MRILVVGSGGREHALCWAIAASPLCDALFCAPGNPGIAEEARCLAVAAEDTEGLIALARRERIDFVVVGPEAPLVAGLADRLEGAGIATFGPSAAAAALEGSKGFTRDLCARHTPHMREHQRMLEEYQRTLGTEEGVVKKAAGVAFGVARDLADVVRESDFLRLVGDIVLAR